ncbi:hypothetical protein BpHYR1_019800 [Brachionus plicatilis]|uniref:Uncharacterized protein n=1 Tax=Brachionus plicatilis TaxID=10195 RepID=A0A3M7T6P2_BRAPC|nr:hypothetical protein BpHYR1_019800 [Brachionus plicatilis]
MSIVILPISPSHMNKIFNKVPNQNVLKYKDHKLQTPLNSANASLSSALTNSYLPSSIFLKVLTILREAKTQF